MITQPPGFKNKLYHYCQRNFVDKGLLDVKLRTDERRLGALPYDWLKSLPNHQYSNITQQVDELFKDFAGATPPMFKEREFFDSYYKEFGFTDKLSKLLNRKDISIEYASEGAYKCCHKLTVGDYDYALLTFRKESWPQNQLTYDTVRGSGAFLEPCRIFDIYRGYSHGRVAKPFMTRFVNDTTASEYDGYMLMKFIDVKDTARAKTEIPRYQEELYRYKMNDRNHGNIINGIIIDIGQMEKLETEQLNKRDKQNLLKFLNRISQNHEENYTMPQLKNITNEEEAAKITQAIHSAEEFVYSLMEDGVDIYNTDMRDLIKGLPPLEQKYVIKKIRGLRKTHNLKLQFQKTGEYEKYKQQFRDFADCNGTWTIKQELLWS